MQKSVKWLLLILVLSFGVNVFALGYFLHQKSKAVEPLSTTSSLAPELKEAFKKLPKEKRQEMIQRLRDDRVKILENQKHIQALRSDLVKALKEEPVNSEKLTSLHNQIQALSAENTKMVQGSILEALAHLPAAEREKIANHLISGKTTSTFQLRNEAPRK